MKGREGGMSKLEEKYAGNHHFFDHAGFGSLVHGFFNPYDSSFPLSAFSALVECDDRPWLAVLVY